MQDTLFPAEAAAEPAATTQNPVPAIPMVSVPQDALRQVLQALLGPSHLIRELQATRNLPPIVGSENPINTLVAAYRAATETTKANT